MNVASILLVNAGAICAMMLGVWAISLARKDASIIDIIWGLGFVLVGAVSFLLADSTGPRRWLLLLLITLWGCRLAGYLAWRNLGKGEDYRYRAMREKHGDNFPLFSLVTVFALQGVVMWIVSLPIQIGLTSSVPLSWLDGCGACIWAIGFVFETVGDLQMAVFKSDPSNQGKVMSRGLWRYTRHPNYFGDFLIWWGLTCIVLSGGGPAWLLVAPLLMSVLLLRVSGVTLLESALRERKPGYEDYMRRTSSFLPRPPRNHA